MDHLGSTASITGSSGPMLGINRYDEYGVSAQGNVSLLQYTGQMWLPEFGLYHYKTRAYHPGLGRFMQTDPIGYGMNLYAYLGGDPVNLAQGEDGNGYVLHVYNNIYPIYR